MSIQINVHLDAEKPLKAKVIFATILEVSQLPMVCFQLDDVNIYFRNLAQIDQVQSALAEARAKLASLLPEDYSYEQAMATQHREDFDAKRRGEDV